MQACAEPQWKSRPYTIESEAKAPPAKTLSNICQCCCALRRLPRALAAVRAAAPLGHKACAKLSHVWIVIPEEHVLDASIPNVVVDSQNLKITSSAVKTRNQTAGGSPRRCSSISCKNLTNKVIQVISSVDHAGGGYRLFLCSHKSLGRAQWSTTSIKPWGCRQWSWCERGGSQRRSCRPCPAHWLGSALSLSRSSGDVLITVPAGCLSSWILRQGHSTLCRSCSPGPSGTPTQASMIIIAIPARGFGCVLRARTLWYQCRCSRTGGSRVVVAIPRSLVVHSCSRRSAGSNSAVGSCQGRRLHLSRWPPWCCWHRGSRSRCKWCCEWLVGGSNCARRRGAHRCRSLGRLLWCRALRRQQGDFLVTIPVIGTSVMLLNVCAC
mmetsp:Transcript_17037/g.28335  ORF Transcript_17037/g.28335 Transcript_17037/m.28335 type:complete len:381 (-) Transcript_17037:1155-2297(-)